MKALPLLVAAAVVMPGGPALAAASSFTLVNATNAQLTSVNIRRTGTEGWRPLAVAASPGGRAAIDFSDPDCAFDIRAEVGGSPVVWPGVNLCEVKVVTLNRAASGAAWVDYD